MNASIAVIAVVSLQKEARFWCPNIDGTQRVYKISAILMYADTIKQHAA